MWTREQFEREVTYRAVMLIAREMLLQEVIDNEDYRAFSTRFVAKYLPVSAGLFSQSDFQSA